MSASIPMVNISLCPFESRGRNVRILFLSDSIFFWSHVKTIILFKKCSQEQETLIWIDAIAYVSLVLTFRNGANLIN